MNSPGHRRIMLSRDFAFAGIAATRKPNGTWIGVIDLGHH